MRKNIKAHIGAFLLNKNMGNKQRSLNQISQFINRNVVGSELQFRTDYENERIREHEVNVAWLATMAADTATAKKDDTKNKKYTLAQFNRRYGNFNRRQS